MKQVAVVVFAGALAGCLAVSWTNAAGSEGQQATAADPCAERTDGPCAFPRFDPTGVQMAGTFSIPGFDENGTMLNYGGSAAGVSEDGKSLYLTCHQNAAGQPARGQIAKVEIPGLGERAQIIEPCQGLSMSQLQRIHPDPNAYKPYIGGVLETGGWLVLSAYISYDADGRTERSHFSGRTLTRLSGPYSGSVQPGLVKSYMGRIPREFHDMLGGDSYVTAGYTSIISRASYGAAFTVFNAADVTHDDFPMTMLLGCPHSVPSCITWNTPQSLWIYNGSEQSGGGAIIPGTRTFVAIEREALGPTCYGYQTKIQANHGKPYRDAVYCYSLADAADQKGPMGYPYQLVMKLYDVADFVDVKQKRKDPWDVKPYDVVAMPGAEPADTIGYIGGGAFNLNTGDYYLTRELLPGDNNDASVTVYSGFAAPGGVRP